MALVLENEFCRVECTEKGGEIKSFFDKTKNQELMYQGNQGWSGSNPSLFPLVGNTATEKYTIHGKEYSMKNHGLIRYATLKGIQKEDSIVLTLDSDENTLKQYPFDFRYEIEYKLVGKKLEIYYRITNTSKEPMPFSFGLHPGFICPQKEGEVFEDYSIDFECEEHAVQFLQDGACVKPLSYQDVTLSSWQLSREDIDKYATLIYKQLKSQYVTLAYKGEGRIKVKIAGYPFLAIWSHPSRSDFICIEPWYGHADFEKGLDDFYAREGTIVLQPDDTFACDYSIEAL